MDRLLFGLGLWNHFGLSVALELLALAAGAGVYVGLRSRRHPVRPVRLAIVLLILAGTYAAAILGPPPPSTTVIAVGDIVFILVLAVLGAWADKAATSAELAAGHAGR